MIMISPSVLASDLSCLAQEAVNCEQAGADMLHLDVMDGHFVNNITLGAPVIASLRKHTRLPFDVHLMIEKPEKYLCSFLDAGADIITFHLEAVENPDSLIQAIREKGAVPGISVKPGTPVENVFPYLPKLGLVLIMTVEPGFGGQAFLPGQLPKISALSRASREKNPGLLIEVDGGINEKTVGSVIAAGANVIVAGSYVFQAQDRAAAIASLR